MRLQALKSSLRNKLVAVVQLPHRVSCTDDSSMFSTRQRSDKEEKGAGSQGLVVMLQILSSKNASKLLRKPRRVSLIWMTARRSIIHYNPIPCCSPNKPILSTCIDHNCITQHLGDTKVSSLADRTPCSSTVATPKSK